MAITDLGSRNYLGEQGGLYPGGSNVPPSAYRTAGIQAAKAMVPLDASGKASPKGRIVFISLGMSNTSLEFAYFAKKEGTDSLRNPVVAMVDGAQGGQPASAWTSASDPTWAVVNKRLLAAGFTSKQVEAVWLKQADAFPTSNFETYAHGLQAELETIVTIAAQRFPNLHQVFVSARTYGGYGVASANPEPYAYQTGFADKFLVAQWVANPSRKPWVGWGPYFWTDGTVGRADGFKWYCSDTSDGTHPSASGLSKLYTTMHSQFATSDFSPWFTRTQSTTKGPSSSGGAKSNAPGSAAGAAPRAPIASRAAGAAGQPKPGVPTLGSQPSAGIGAAGLASPRRTSFLVATAGEWSVAAAAMLLITAFITALARVVIARRGRRFKIRPPSSG